MEPLMIDEYTHWREIGYEAALGTAVAMLVAGVHQSTIVEATGIGRTEYLWHYKNYRRELEAWKRVRKVALARQRRQLAGRQDGTGNNQAE